MTEVSGFPQHLWSPREGHFNDVYKVFRYLQKHLSNNPERIAFDPDCLHTDEKVFERSTRELDGWKDFYLDVEEAHLRKNLELLGEPVTLQVYADTNYPDNLENMTSYSGILINVNNALINFYNKRHNTVESSSFGSEFVALRIATEVVEALRHKHLV